MPRICSGPRAEAHFYSSAVKLLFDHNLSFRLVSSLGEFYPESVHVRTLNLHRAVDEVVWQYARQHGFVIVSKDVDFHQRSLVLGAPPKVVWVALGNCSTREIADLLRQRHHEILVFGQDADAAFLALA